MSGVVCFTPIGTIHTEHTSASETPIQPPFAKGCPGRIELLPEYEEGLNDINGFSHVIVLYHLDRAGPPSLLVQPFLDDKLRGVFATRHPCRPNPIGLSILRLTKCERTTLFVDDVDILDGTPVLDIKPFLPRCDMPEDHRGGWMDHISPSLQRQRGRRGYRPSASPSVDEMGT